MSGLKAREELKVQYTSAQYHRVIEIFLENKTIFQQDAEPLYLCGSALHNLGKHAEAINFLNRAAGIAPELDNIFSFLGLSYYAIGNIHNAYDAYQQALENNSDDIQAKWFGSRLLPYVYKTQDEISTWRRNFQNAIAKLTKTPIGDQENARKIISGILMKSNFEITYQGENDIDLLKSWGNFTHAVTNAAFPEYSGDLPRKNASGRKIKVAFVAEHFYSHTICLLFGNWVSTLDKSRFHISTYITDGYRDKNTELVAEDSDIFVDLRNIDISEAIRTIYEANADIIIYPDLGMGTRSFIIASCRLAPVQCMTWGHPVTSGLPTMDYFITSREMEPVGGEEHYSEKLIKLPSIGIFYTLTPLRQRERSDDEATVQYLCCQAIQKYLPKYDYIFPEIASHVVNAKFIFIEHQTRTASNRSFKSRLKNAFESYGISFEKHIAFLPWQEWAEFLQLCADSDVFLDSIEWSGGNTSLEALSQNLPPVTLPKKLMRSRHTTAMLNVIGLPELIAEDEEQYIEIAIKLGQNRPFRLQIREKIEGKKHKLYYDKQPISALEHALVQSLGRE